MLHLDLLRFVASFGIVFHHSLEYFFAPANRLAAIERFHGLALFVDLFFVISGFVIAYVYGDRVKTLVAFGRFMQRRVARLWPLHLVTLAAAIALSLLIALVHVTMNHPPALTAKCVAATALLLHAVYSCGGIIFNGVSWSISTEIVMYLAFPLLVFGVRHHGLWALAVAIALLAWLLFRPGQGPLVRDWTLGFAPLRALPSFLFGAALFYCRGALPVVRSSPLLFALAVIALIGSMTTSASTWVVMALVYITGLCGVLADKSRLVRPFVRRSAALGQLTYSVYMIHYLAIMVLLNGIGDKLLHLSGAAIVPFFALTYAVILIISYVSYQYFETPVRRWIDSRQLFG